MKVIRLAGTAAACLGFLVLGCGDDNKATPLPDSNEAGAASVVTYPPALGPEDCATSTSEITLSQPAGAAVWGGLVVLDLEVEGAKVDDFDIQVFDPALDVWVTSYANSGASGQRQDGSYFLAITPPFNEVNKDEELRVRVRPTQEGCPEADWTESEPFSAGDPLAGTSWRADIPGLLFNNEYTLYRNAIPEGTTLPSYNLGLGDTTLDLDFGKQGELTQTVSFSLEANVEPDAEAPEEVPLNGCSFVFTFSGTYELVFRQQYGSMMLFVSDQTLTSTAGSTCELPSVEEMNVSSEDFKQKLSAYTQGVGINYVATLYAEPGPPRWLNSGFGEIFQQLSQFLAYATDNETGSVQGYVYPIELELEQQ